MSQYPETDARDDFWRQVKRTVHGEPVSQEQIDMIIAAVRDGLDFSPEDGLLDLGCGNGALSSYLFENIRWFHGVDSSKYLIDIAKEYFERLPCYSFRETDIISYVKKAVPARYLTKCLCYGVLHFLSNSQVQTVLGLLYKRFPYLSTVFIGNSPDRDRAHRFFPGEIDLSSLDKHDTPIGVWRTESAFVNFASQTGWSAEFRNMPDDYHASHYRFDIILRRPSGV